MDFNVHDHAGVWVGIIENPTSAIWARRYQKPNDFELHLPVSAEILALLADDFYITRDAAPEAMIVEHIEIKTSAEEGNYILVSGRGAESIIDTPEELAAAFKASSEMGLKSGMLVCNPIPEEFAMPKDVIDAAIAQAIAECNDKGIKGKETTPFLLARVAELTGGNSLASNIRLVYNNAKVAAQTAVHYCNM